MRIISRRTLREFVDGRAGSHDRSALRAALDAWFAETSKPSWTSSGDINKLYVNAGIISADRIIFNIRGNNYRLIVAVDFEKAIVWIKWIGTHADYDRINARTVEHGD